MLELLPGVDNPTPIVRLNKVTPYKHTQVYAKLEWYNPFGSVKDRVAANLIRDAEERGVLGGDTKHLVEPTSGGTGMGLVMVGNLKGYTLTTPLSADIPKTKKTVLRFFGTEVIELDDSLCPAPGAPEGAMVRASEIATKPGYHQLNQYQNQANPDAHYRTTGPEIWKQTGGKVTHYVCGLGTCGTITGTGRYLKEKNPEIKVLGVDPAEGHDIPGVRSKRQLMLTDFFHPDEYDGTQDIDNQEAYALCARLNREEGIIAGPSSAMALAGAFKMIPDEERLVVVVIFPDNIFKYTDSVIKHLPDLFPVATPEPSTSSGARGDAASAEKFLLRKMLESARNSDDVIDMGGVEDLVGEEGTTFLDVRTPEEFAEGHIEGSVNIPESELKAEHEALPSKEGTVVTVCNVGKASLRALLLLKAMGYRDVKNLMGGLGSWVAEGNMLEES
ncbi:MAG: pyridoxal-phosphate dependent enzyme [Myxococcales bacterium]|nr:pyridoxal-phosphate dependent enzyme [Myxococcales bacterium]